MLELKLRTLPVNWAATMRRLRVLKSDSRQAAQCIYKTIRYLQMIDIACSKFYVQKKIRKLNHQGQYKQIPDLEFSLIQWQK